MYPNDEIYDVDELDPMDELDDVEAEIEEDELEEDDVIDATLGVVENCTKLNVRFKPNPKSDVVCVLDANTEVLIEEDGSTDDFYKIYASSGIEGYCMKKYITVLP